MTTQTISPESPIAEIERWLVELACECHCHLPDMRHGNECEGSRRRFPDFSRECSYDWHNHQKESLLRAYAEKHGCPQQGCTDGRVAAITLEAVLEYGDDWEITRIGGGSRRLVVRYSLAAIGPTTHRGEGPTSLEAAERALVAAVIT